MMSAREFIRTLCFAEDPDEWLTEGLTLKKMCRTYASTPPNLAARQVGITEETHYKWRKEYGGMNSADARRMKELERENARLKKLVAELRLDNTILKDVNPKNS